MKFLFSKLTSFVGVWGITFFVITYVFEKQWENALCWGCCLALFIGCRYYEEKAEEIEKLNQFLMGKKINEMTYSVLKMMADFEREDNGKEQ